MEVKDGLPGRGLARVDEVDPVAAQALLHPAREALGASRGAGEVVQVDVVQVPGVPPRDHQRVAAGPRVDVHECDRVLVLVHQLRRDLAGEDLAEETVVVHSQPARLKRV